MGGKIILVTGGARSGKSSFAERYASSLSNNVTYIATAQCYDDEMKARIALHRKRRPDTWPTLESPYNAHEAIQKASENTKVILFDCLTVYTSNLLLAAESQNNAEARYQYIMSQIDLLINSADSSNATIIFVTNEVGMGIVPDNALAREYRDLAGMVNQKIAAAAAEVYLVVSGIAVDVKKLAVAIS